MNNKLVTDYLDFISNCKTERECIEYAKNILEKTGFKGHGLKANTSTSNVYITKMDKTIAAFKFGKEPLESGMNIVFLKSNNSHYVKLEWIPSTSPHPGADHQVFWGTVRPVNDSFWSEHRPGDRWNCKCELRQTEADATIPPMPTDADNPQPGLENNPGRDGELFSQKHPYYPSGCMSCPFAGGHLAALMHGLAHKQNCHQCEKVNKVIRDTKDKPSYNLTVLKEFKNGGKLSEYNAVDHNKSDYRRLRAVGRWFAEQGKNVILTPQVHFKDEKYSEIYAGIPQEYWKKCPDIKIDDVFYEFEGFDKPWKKKKVGRMLSHGLEQSDRIIIDNTKGCSHRYIRKLVRTRKMDYNVPVKEVWLYEKGEVIPLLLYADPIKQQ